MKGKFISGIVAGSLVGATAGMYAMNKMSPRQRRKMMKMGKKVINSMVNDMELF